MSSSMLIHQLLNIIYSQVLAFTQNLVYSEHTKMLQLIYTFTDDSQLLVEIA